MQYRTPRPSLSFGVILFSLLLFSCSRPKKCNTPEELSKTVYALFQKQEAGQLKKYLIGKSEVETAFGSSPQYTSLTDEEKKIFVSSTYERNKEIGENFIEFYTGGDPASTNLLINGKPDTTIAEIRDDNGTSVAKMVNYFTVDGKKHELNLRAAKVKDYWKLLSWIEVK